MSAKYDQIGINYATKRKSDPRIAQQIWDHLSGAERILNIGAGSGSYEPEDVELVALEPSIEMINQRPFGSHPVVQGVAETLPFPDGSFTHALTILSMHHWTDRSQAFQEINRVATHRFVAVTWNPTSNAFWLTRDYFPEIEEIDRSIFPSLEEFDTHFDDVAITPLLIPEDCVDGFLAAYWKRPSAYLDPAVRNSISSFARLSDVDTGLAKLAQDIADGTWHRNNQAILEQSALDAGYVMVSGKTRGED